MNPLPSTVFGRTSGRRTRQAIVVATGAALAVGVLLPTATAATAATSAVAAPVTLTGTVHDGSAHGWPLWAKVSVDGLPGASTYSGPASGEFSLTIPDDTARTLTVTVQYPGYPEISQEVTTDEIAAGTVDLAVPVDESICVAPGYRHTSDGLIEAFDAGTTPEGWTVSDHVGNEQTWRFDNIGERDNLTGGTAGFAIVDSDFWGYDSEFEGRQDTELISPVVDLSDVAEPVIGFNTDFTMFNYSEPSGIGDVLLSVDGGDHWENIWHVEAKTLGPLPVSIPVPQAAGQQDVRVKFHYHETDVTAGRWWELDNVYVGNRRCAAVDGGLLTGLVTDANTGEALTDARVAVGETATSSLATPDDEKLDDGFYWLFAPGSGEQSVTAGKRLYQDLTASVSLDGATVADLALPAGRLQAETESLQADPQWGSAATVPVTVSNTGTAPLTMWTAERPGDFEIEAGRGEPWSGLGEPAAEWTTLADYPLSIRDNIAAVHDGKLYSVGGVPTNTFGAPTDQGYVYDPQADSWSPIAPMPRARQEGAGAFVGDKFYYAAGTTGDFGNEFVSVVDIYDPATDSWSTGADYPAGQADVGYAVLGTDLYVIGGCDDRRWCGSTGVYRYDTTGDSWSQVADYPEPLSWMRCGAIEEQIYCTGGARDISENSTATYAYDPAADAWTPRADLPIPMYKMASTVADGKLLISGGVHNKLSTTQGFAYDPVTDSWSDLPASINEVSRAGSACGFYKVGGAQSWSSGTPFVEKLSGYDDCRSDRDTPWLSADSGTVTLAPGESTSVDVHLDATDVDQPGSYTADVLLRSDTPYGQQDLPVTMAATAPRLFGKILGTVTGTRCDGTSQPLPDANVWIRAGDERITLQTDDQGRYARWISVKGNPLQVTVGADDWTIATAKNRVKYGAASVQDVELQQLGCG